jgi:hypothetical protein
MIAWENALRSDRPNQYDEWPIQSREDLDATSVHRQEGLSANDEAFYRRFYSQFISEVALQLNM